MKKAKDKTMPTMFEVLQNLQCDGRQKAAAFRFLRTDLAKLRSFQAIEEAASGLIAAQQLLGPLDPGYLHTLSELRKMLDVTIKRRLIPAVHCAACKSELQAAWQDVCNLFAKYVPAELWEKLGEKTRAFFDGINDPRGDFSS
jgi:hypothetical protein